MKITVDISDEESAAISQSGSGIECTAAQEAEVVTALAKIMDEHPLEAVLKGFAWAGKRVSETCRKKAALCVKVAQFTERVARAVEEAEKLRKVDESKADGNARSAS